MNVHLLMVYAKNHTDSKEALIFVVDSELSIKFRLPETPA